MATALQMLEHAADAHDGFADRWLSISGRTVAVNGAFADGTTWREPVGRVDEPGVFESACEAAGVVSSRLVEDGGVVSVELTYSSGNVESEYLTSLDHAGAWRFIPCELFDAFEAMVEEMED